MQDHLLCCIRPVLPFSLPAVLRKFEPLPGAPCYKAVQSYSYFAPHRPLTTRNTVPPPLFTLLAIVHPDLALQAARIQLLPILLSPANPLKQLLLALPSPARPLTQLLPCPLPTC